MVKNKIMFGEGLPSDRLKLIVSNEVTEAASELCKENDLSCADYGIQNRSIVYYKLYISF